MLWVLIRGTSNEYSHNMFWWRNKNWCPHSYLELCLSLDRKACLKLHLSIVWKFLSLWFDLRTKWDREVGAVLFWTNLWSSITPNFNYIHPATQEICSFKNFNIKLYLNMKVLSPWPSPQAHWQTEWGGPHTDWNFGPNISPSINFIYIGFQETWIFRNFNVNLWHRKSKPVTRKSKPVIFTSGHWWGLGLQWKKPLNL